MQFRMMSDELGIPSALSARASLDVAIAMGCHVAQHGGGGGGGGGHRPHMDRMDETMGLSSRIPSTSTETQLPTTVPTQLISSQIAETTDEMSIQQYAAQITSSTASVHRNSNILPCSELVYDVSQTIEKLQHHAGIPTHHDKNNINMLEKETNKLSFVEALCDADVRLKSCLHEATVVRTALHSLRTEELTTEMAIRDYDDRPAQHL